MGQAKQRGTYEERVKKAKEQDNIPSFIKRLDIDAHNNITYNKSDLVSTQCDFIDGCIKTWKNNGSNKKPDLFGFVFWGNKEDFSGVLLSRQQVGSDPEKMFGEAQDMFFSRYWGSTNQQVVLSADYCDKVMSGTPFLPIGAKLGDAKHKYSNFAIAVAYNRKFGLLGCKSQVGDLCPPECDPNDRLYNENFIPKVKEALSEFDIEVECAWEPGSVHTTFKKIA